MKKFGPRNPTRKNRHPRKGRKGKLRKNPFLNSASMREMRETLICLSIGEFFRPFVRQAIKSNSASKKADPSDSSTTQRKENA